MDSLKALSFSTFGGNPLSAAAGLATLRYVQQHDLQNNARLMGQRLREQLEAVAARKRWIAEVRGRGLMQAIEIVYSGTLEPDQSQTKALLEACKQRGLLLGKGGLFNNVIRITPMLNVSQAELDEGVAALVDAIESLAEVGA